MFAGYTQLSYEDRPSRVRKFETLLEARAVLVDFVKSRICKHLSGFVVIKDAATGEVVDRIDVEMPYTGFYTFRRPYNTEFANLK